MPLRWSYTLSSSSLMLTTFSIRLNDGSFDDVGVISSGNPVVFDKNDYRTRFDISGSEVATLIINKVTQREEAVYQCKLTTDTNQWSYRMRVIATGESISKIHKMCHLSTLLTTIAGLASYGQLH